MDVGWNSCDGEPGVFASIVGLLEGPALREVVGSQSLRHGEDRWEYQEKRAQSGPQRRLRVKKSTGTSKSSLQTLFSKYI